MIKNNKRIIIFTTILISILIIYISINLILIWNSCQKKQINSNFILNLSKVNPIETNNNSIIKCNNNENIISSISEQNNVNNVQEIVGIQYKSNNWRIKIPKLNLDAPIIEGTTSEVLKRGVGHFNGSSMWDGNVCLAAHNRGYRCSFFQEIKNLEIGDVIIYETQFGTKKYKVQMNKIIKETDWSDIENTNENRITLITCIENMREYRRCVIAKET